MVDFTLEQWLLIILVVAELSYDVAKGTIDFRRMKSQDRMVEIQNELLKLKRVQVDGNGERGTSQ